MPWTKRQVRYLLSKVSPLNEDEENKMKEELHENPGLIKKHTGFQSVQKAVARGKGKRRA